MIHVCRGVVHINAYPDASPDLPDDHKISDGEWWSVYTPNSWWIPWTLPEWHQEQRTTLYVRDVRLPVSTETAESPEIEGV